MRGLRVTAVAFVLALLLPASLATGGLTDAAAPRPLDLFGADRGPWPLLAEVYYNALRDDEYVTLANPGPDPVDLAGWTLADGEGVLTFPPGSTIPGGARVVVAQNATAHEENTLWRPDYQYRGGDATAMGRWGTFQLNNAGDEVILRDASGLEVDVLAYGTSPYAGPGWVGAPARALPKGYVAHRGDLRGDTDTASDWDLLRVRSLGQADLPRASFRFAGEALAYVSPDEPRAPLLALLSTANETIDVSVYTLTSGAVAGALQEAIRRGVRVRVLLEGGPVGGIDEVGWRLAQEVAAAGADVRFMVDDTARDVQERFRYLHAKYAILDRETVLVSSENLGASGYPEAGRTGSRGWSLAVRHAPLAAYFLRAFEEDADLRRRDIRPLAAMEVVPSSPRPAPEGAFPARFPARRLHGDFAIVPVLGPDHAVEAILQSLRSARESLHVQAFYAHLAWEGSPNPFLEELVAAARRGVEVRLLLDASPWAADGEGSDNLDTVRALATVAREEGLDLAAKLVDLSAHGYVRLHNKGFVVDRRLTLVSSINWNHNSATANREAGLLVENGEVAAYFGDVFAWDWKDDLNPPIADAGPDRTVHVGTVVALSSLGSWDDVGIVNTSWDLDGDGAFDAWEPEPRTSYARPGTFEVRLRVRDAAGNVGEDVARVVVQGPPPPATGFPLLPLAAAGAALVASVAAMRRFGTRINKRHRIA